MFNSKMCFLFLALVWWFVFVPVFVSRGEEPVGQPELPQALRDAVIKRIPKLEMYPCNDCHSTAADFNANHRELVEEHTDKGVHYAKGKDERWCQSCHEEGNYLKLHLLSGKNVSLNESHLLCGQCHSNNYKDWLRNAHGKRVGSWSNGLQKIYSCPECHNPHQPPFKLMEAKKPPLRPVNDFWSY